MYGLNGINHFNNSHMSNKKSIITLKDYLAKSKDFIIPDYQRGYIWGKNRRVKNKQDQDSVTYMLESIHEGYVSYVPIFIQGVTVFEEHNSITIIDGQQRTTFFYLLLCYLQYKEKFDIKYDVRNESDKFLEEIKGNSKKALLTKCTEDENESFQDIYFFKKTIRIIDECLNKWGIDMDKLRDYLLDNIQFLYIDISKDKEKVVFTMMNGNRANMSTEDLIKAEFLRMVSLDLDDTEIVRREQDLLRSRYAREWDRWLRWWNQSRVLSFYKIERDKKPLTLLLSTFHHSYLKRERDDLKRERDDFNFENFRARVLLTKTGAQKAFKELRHLQKKFEDVFNDVNPQSHRHNSIGGILTVLPKKYAQEFIYDYFSRSMNREELDEVFKLSFMGGLTYLEINGIVNGKQEDSLVEKYEQAKLSFKEAINSSNMYNNTDYKEVAFRQLLLLNIEYDSQLGRMFNFSAYENRSIEHIFPKSRVFYEVNGKKYSCEDKSPVNIDSNWINEEDLKKKNCSQHGIGNFALLYTYNNSKLGNKSFSEKKKILFGTKDSDDVFQSRELLHTISLFSYEKWGLDEIVANKNNVIYKLERFYDIRQ